MKELYIRFMAPVIPQSTTQLLQVVDKALADKVEKLHLLLSSPGGTVFHGLSLYNFLRGLPIEVWTYNFGSVDSIGVVIFCSGHRRFSVPHARFLIHGVRFNIQGNASFDDKQLEENLKGLKIDQENIARVIADTTGKPLHTIEEDMTNRTTLNPSQAKDYGLVHEIQSTLFPVGATLAVIGEPLQAGPQLIVQATAPAVQAYTRSRDLDVGTT
jgi:ATP-dependent Clp endopeptidase proteolytic subunit ClpP